jgi:hypothetical protein
VLESALAYVRMKWRIFPCHSIVEGQCSCGKPACGSPGKHPRTKGGFKDATNDEAQIRRWWTRWPTANIALATGDGIAVFDIDGEEGFREFQTFVAQHGRVPETLTSQTGRGAHLIFASRAGAPSVRSAAVGKVHIRGDGGYIILPPSNHISGRNYQWVKKVPLAILPDTLRQWGQGYEVTKRAPEAFNGLGALPAHLQNQNTKDISVLASESLKTVYSSSEHARIASALQAIPVKTCSYDDFLRIGMALKELDWQKSDGTDIGYELWDAWCSMSEHHNPAGLEFKWNSFKRSGVSVGSIYHMAREAGWTGGAQAPAAAPLNGHHPTGMNGTANGVNGNHALPAAFLAAGNQIFFPDRDDEGRPKSTCTNAGVAVKALAIGCKKDLFHEKFMVAGEPINAWAGDMSDDVIQMIRKTIRARFGFDPKVENTRDACTQLCLENQFDPVCDYLDGLQWDRTPRLNTWLTHYMGAPDTELNRAIGRLTLVAAVRRAYEPGAKFDQIVVFESVEGKGKSTAVEILAGPDNFSDQHIMGVPGREQQEAMTGVWLYEIADLTGMKKADVESVKAFASRKVDRARPAYGRFRVDRPRRTIFFATTNDNEYLKSETGNRRFWPVVTSQIDLAALRRDRDQLWAEAAVCEARGDSIALPERLWKAAGEEQDRRKEGDDWFEKINNYVELKGCTDVTVSDVLCDNQWIQRKPDMVSRADAMRAGAILKRLRFVRYHKRIENGYAWRYRREPG